jgi:hypothetical protein
VSFDDLRSKISKLLASVSAGCAELFATCHHGAAFEVVIAGISESDGPTAYVVPSDTRYGNAAPFDLIPIKGFVALPNSATISAAMAPLMPTSGNADEVDPARVGLAVMEIQRANPDVGDCLCPVGGFAQLTTVTADSVTSRIIHRWPD